MATMQDRAKIPVGSAHWVLDERQHADSVVSQEVEEFAFSARNDVEWLNEHMTEIFSQTEFDVTEIFKTPGKLRGKTPRTARRQNPEARAPLTDIFTANGRPLASPAREKINVLGVSPVRLTENKENQDKSRSPQNRHVLAPETQVTDSGYHGMTEDEMEIGSAPAKSKQITSFGALPRTMLGEQVDQGSSQKPPRTVRSETAESFVSAKEDQSSRIVGRTNLDGATIATETPIEAVEELPISRAISPDGQAARQSHQYSVSTVTAAALDDALEKVERESPVRPTNSAADDDSPSQGSSPHRPVIRKKSSFASLPAREPLTTGKSIGTRVSQKFARDSTRGVSAVCESILGKAHSSRNVPNEQEDSDPEEGENVSAMDTDDDMTASLARPNSETSKVHSKTSTQKLHEKFSLLGKTSQPRPSKSIPSAATAKQTGGNTGSHRLATRECDMGSDVGEDNDDKWIGPIEEKAAHNSCISEVNSADPATLSVHERVTGGVKETSGATAGTSSLSQPNAQMPPTGSKLNHSTLKAADVDSTTPIGTPISHWKNEGPLSASKAKFNSFLKSARGMFASSAATSAQAKMATLSPAASRTKAHPEQPLAELFDPSIQTELDTRTDMNPIHRTQAAEPYPLLAKSHEDEALQSQGAQRHMPASKQEGSNGQGTHHPKFEPGHDENLSDKVSYDLSDASLPQNTQAKSTSDKPTDMLTASQPKASASITHTKLGEARRPVKPSKVELSKGRPAAMSIRVGSQKIGQHGAHSTNLHSTQNEAMLPPPKPNHLEKKTSTSSLRSASSAQTSRAPGTGTSSRLKALQAADRKRERDEKEAQRKAEQKRKIEEERRQAQAQKQAEQQQQRAAEQQRMLEAKINAQKHAAEQRKAEQLRKNEQTRQRMQLPLNQHQDRLPLDGVPIQSQQRAEGAFSRPVHQANHPSQGNTRPPQPHINPAKPPLKRQFVPDPEEEGPRFAQSQQPIQQISQNVKRRRTSEDPAAQCSSRPTMAPPIRLSRKDLPSKFSQSFMNSTSQQAPSMLKTAVNAAHQAQHPKTPHVNDLAKFSKAPIPFAETSNPPQHHSLQHQHRPPPIAKTPGTASKPSPNYPNGDNISLPEIATDSEDSDSDNEFVPPEWANSPELRQLLKQQQLVDPMKVFGPIAPLAMEEVFKGNKERQAKFRARTSSANWNGPDRLTEEERKRDIEARERLEKDGGWSFNAGI